MTVAGVGFVPPDNPDLTTSGRRKAAGGQLARGRSGKPGCDPGGRQRDAQRALCRRSRSRFLGRLEALGRYQRAEKGRVRGARCRAQVPSHGPADQRGAGEQHDGEKPDLRVRVAASDELSPTGRRFIRCLARGPVRWRSGEGPVLRERRQIKGSDRHPNHRRSCGVRRWRRDRRVIAGRVVHDQRCGWWSGRSAGRCGEDQPPGVAVVSWSR
jgi:hypothetical protein